MPMRPRVRGTVDRSITVLGLGVAAAYTVAATMSFLLPEPGRRGIWLPAHLALAGAASTAIAAALPFFTSALAATRPAQPSVRLLGIVGVAAGAAMVMATWLGSPGRATNALGGGLFLAGLLATAIATFAPLRGALGPRRPLIVGAYAAALANVAVGATIATALLAGSPVVAASWAHLKPAHAWLNLVGFVSLVIAATLLHLGPTVVGARIRPRMSGRIAVSGLAIGAPVVAVGFAGQLDLVVRLGAIVVISGAAGIAGHGVAVDRDPDRGRWTTDEGWHAFTRRSLLAGQAWLALGVAVAAARALRFGADPGGWSLTVLGGPILVGGIVQVLIGAMTHLLPAVGPGDARTHARQRRVLGQAATARWVVLNVGVAMLFGGVLAMDGAGSAGSTTGLGIAGVLVRLGTIVAGLAVLASVGLLIRALPPLAPSGSRSVGEIAKSGGSRPAPPTDR